LLHLVGCLYYLYQWCTVKQISHNEIYLLIKYIQRVLWRVAKRLSYIEDARCVKVKYRFILMSCQICSSFSNLRPTPSDPLHASFKKINVLRLPEGYMWPSTSQVNDNGQLHKFLCEFSALL